MASDIEIVQGALEAFGRRDVATLLDLLAEDVAFDEPDPAAGSLRKRTTSAQEHGVPWVQPCRGKEEVRRHFERVGERLEVSRFDVVRLVGGGGLVVAWCDVEGKVKKTGTPFASEPLFAVTLRDGRVQSVLQYLDTAKAIDICAEQDAAGAGVHAGEGI